MSAPSQHYHFIGICGTAMGAVAAAMKDRGFTISGSDAKVYPPMSTFLESKGIRLMEGYRAENIPAEADVIVVGNAISRGNAECEEVLNRRLLYTSLPELLKHRFLHGKRNYVVTGTHGKTTTSSLLAWLFESAGQEPSYMIGGIARNFGQGGHFTSGPFTILEGDEYDTAFFDKRSKFVHYLPECVIVNNVEFDHADIYNSLDEIQLSFSRLFRIVPQNGMVLLNGDCANSLHAARECPAPMKTIGLGEANEIRISGIAVEGTGTRFDLNGVPFWLPMDGEFNVRNAAMTIVAARFAGLGDEAIRLGLKTFLGIARRQDVRGEVNGVKVIDDFGHHPTAIRETAAALRLRHLPEGSTGRLWSIFEPRSNTTRRKIFQNDLVTAFATSDGAFIAEIPDIQKIPEADRLDPQKLVSDVRAQFGIPCHLAPDADGIVAQVIPLVRPGDVIAVFSNGGFGGIHGKLLAALAEV
jgi:UDP-N-acetylmuramate: L-alanyl-gamma-D-glutamyl-meso-diaminopimelate ligase